MKNEVRTFRHADPRQDRDVVAERAIVREKPRILVRCRVEAVLPLVVVLIDLRPGRREGYTAMVAVGPARLMNHIVAYGVFKCRGGIEQISVEEDSALKVGGRLPIDDSRCDRSPREGCGINPGQRRGARYQLFSNDPTARLFDHGITPLPEGSEQSRFVPARAARDHDAAVHLSRVCP